MHATMAIYNAWADRVPVMIVGGNDLDAAHRAPGVPTYHSGQDINAFVRDITKWDDNPVSLQHFAQSFVRAYKMSMTPPYEPVMIALDGGLQEEPIGEHAGSLYIPKYVQTVAAARRTGRAARDRQAAGRMRKIRSSSSTAWRVPRTASIFWCNLPSSCRRR